MFCPTLHPPHLLHQREIALLLLPWLLAREKAAFSAFTDDGRESLEAKAVDVLGAHRSEERDHIVDARLGR